MSLEERMSKLDLASGNASSQFRSIEPISGIQQNDSKNYGSQQQVKNSLANYFSILFVKLYSYWN